MQPLQQDHLARYRTPLATSRRGKEEDGGYGVWSKNHGLENTMLTLPVTAFQNMTLTLKKLLEILQKLWHLTFFIHTALILFFALCFRKIS